MTQEELLSQILEVLNATNDRLDIMHEYTIERDKQIDVYLQEKDAQIQLEKEEAKAAKQAEIDSLSQTDTSAQDYTKILSDMYTQTVELEKSLSTSNESIKVSNTFGICLIVLLGLLCGVTFARIIWRKF